MEKRKTFFLSPNKRFEATRIVLSISIGRITKELETSRHIYKNVITGRSPLPAEWVSYMEEKYRVSYNWVLLGRGDVCPKVTTMRPIGSTKDRQPIYKEEFDKLIELTKHDKTIQKDTKLKLIRAFTLLYFTGCRVCEILDFTLEDIEIICRNKISSLGNDTKTKRPRALRFNEEGVRVLSRLDYSDCPSSGFLFYKNASDMYMSEGAFTRLLNTYLSDKLSDLYTTHSFRAGYITRIVEATGNLETARSLVGHSSIKTTIGYLSATQKQMNDALDKVFKAES